MSSNGYANPDVLVDTRFVNENLDNPDIRFVEVDVDTTAYDSGHIPGAVGWNWHQDTQDTLSRNVPDTGAFEALMSRSGIAEDTMVVLYGDTNNWFAAFGFWLLTYYGHENVRLLNGGRKLWEAEGHPMDTDLPQIQATSYKVSGINEDVRAMRDLVLERAKSNGGSLVDVRSPEEFSGKLLAPENLPQEGAQRGGHIPRAANIPWSMAVNDDGTFKSEKELRAIYEGKGITPENEVIAYCRIGERSSHTWFVLQHLLGLPKVRNYDGSWTEYGSLIGAPIER